jgi:hypothetical protein
MGQEIRDLYLETLTSCSQVDEFRGKLDRVQLMNSCPMIAVQEADSLDTVASSLELIASEAAVKAARQLARTVRKIASYLHDGINEKEPYRRDA